MQQHSVTSTRDQSLARDSEDAERSDAQPLLARMVPVAGLAMRRRPVEASGPPTIRRTLVDNSGQTPVSISTEAQLSTYPWWTALSEMQQAYLTDLATDPSITSRDLNQALAAVPRRALTGGIDMVNLPSWDLVAQLYEQYVDVVCADPELNFTLAEILKEKKKVDFSGVQDVLQRAP